MSVKQKSQEKNKMSEIDDRIIKYFDIKKRLGKGAYGIVWKAQDKRTGQVVAIKKIFDAFRNETDAQRTFREIMFLRAFGRHENIIHLHNIYKASNHMDIYLSFEYMESDLHNVIKRGTILKDVHKRFVMYQLFNATKYIHSGNVIHRDLKPSNVLIDSKCRCKIADFGLARSVSLRSQGDGPKSDPLDPILTDYVATRWYRAPEILVASKRYTKGIDLWSLGCILGEMIKGKPLFPGSCTVNQVERIITALPEVTERDIKAVGPSFGTVLLNQSSLSHSNVQKLDDLLAGSPDDAKNLVKSLLVLDPAGRLTAKQAMSHKYVEKFRNMLSEEELSVDIVPPFRDDIQLSISEYRSKIYEIMSDKHGKDMKADTPLKVSSAVCKKSIFTKNNQEKIKSKTITNIIGDVSMRQSSDHRTSSPSMGKVSVYQKQQTEKTVKKNSNLAQSASCHVFASTASNSKILRSSIINGHDKNRIDNTTNQRMMSNNEMDNHEVNRLEKVLSKNKICKITTYPSSNLNCKSSTIECDNDKMSFDSDFNVSTHIKSQDGNLLRKSDNLSKLSMDHRYTGDISTHQSVFPVKCTPLSVGHPERRQSINDMPRVLNNLCPGKTLSKSGGQLSSDVKLTLDKCPISTQKSSMLSGKNKMNIINSRTHLNQLNCGGKKSQVIIPNKLTVKTNHLSSNGNENILIGECELMKDTHKSYGSMSIPNKMKPSCTEIVHDKHRDQQTRIQRSMRSDLLQDPPVGNNYVYSDKSIEIPYTTGSIKNTVKDYSKGHNIRNGDNVPEEYYETRLRSLEEKIRRHKLDMKAFVLQNTKAKTMKLNENNCCEDRDNGRRPIISTQSDQKMTKTKIDVCRTRSENIGLTNLKPINPKACFDFTYPAGDFCRAHKNQSNNYGVISSTDLFKLRSSIAS